jgi:hypothetical protein
MELLRVKCQREFVLKARIEAMGGKGKKRTADGAGYVENEGTLADEQERKCVMGASLWTGIVTYPFRLSVRDTRPGVPVCRSSHTMTDERSRRRGKRGESTKRCWIVAQS